MKNKCSINEFWSRFLEIINSQGIQAPFDRWYVKRAEEYICAFPNKRLKEHSKKDVTDYLTEFGRKKDLKDWQFRQVVTSLRLLFTEIVKSPWAAGMDWEFWNSSSKRLGRKHATVARDYGPSPKKFIHDKENFPDQGQMDTTHRAVIDDLVVEIRRRGYSIRTEQVYASWVRRFIVFHGNSTPSQMGDSEVVGYLEFLAVKRRVSASTQNQALNALVFLRFIRTC